MFRSSNGLAKTMSSAALEIRPFRDADGTRVRELFIEVNRLLSPAELRDAFDAYIERALADEIDRIEVYYPEHGGAFWVVTLRGGLVGMFGLERASDDAMELPACMWTRRRADSVSAAKCCFMRRLNAAAAGSKDLSSAPPKSKPRRSRSIEAAVTD